MIFSAAPSYRKYGFETNVEGPWQEGAPIKWIFHLSDGPFDIENYHLNVAVHEEAFRRAGFREVRWHAPQLSSEAPMEKDQDFWSTLLEYPPMTFIECFKWIDEARALRVIPNSSGYCPKMLVDTKLPSPEISRDTYVCSAWFAGISTRDKRRIGFSRVVPSVPISK